MATPPTAATQAPVRRERLDRTARVTVALLFSAWLVDYVDRLVINLALPSVGREFGLDRTEQGLAVAVFFLAYALCQIPGGLLADRFGAKRTAGWALLVWSAFTALTGLAGSFAVLLVVRFLFGAAEGVFPAAAMKAVSERTTPGQRMGANGLVSSSNALAAVVAPVLGAPLIVAFGWRWAFFSIAVVGVLVSVALRLWLPAPAGSAVVPVGPAPGGVRTVLASAVMWRFAAMFFGYDLIVWGLNTWVPTYLNDERGISLTAAGAAALVPAVVSAVAAVAGGRIADRLGGRHALVVAPAMAVTAVCVLLMASAQSLAAFVGWLTLAALGAGLSFMPIFAVPMRSLPAELAGAGSGMIIFGGQLAGVVAPVVMGTLADAVSFRAAFAFLVLGAALAAALALTTPQDTEGFLSALHGRRPSEVAADSTRTEAGSTETDNETDNETDKEPA
ncbi:MFS transporter [Kitasatospora xanthocidica]|uniref:MFS transporter n=1 Tax=Kitasatospora xanthocidica TaxID=83382 RepID=UPI001675695C|nr:MFS transporter [Kitasatospora xanthocidica]GHF76637.1 MFS transporter [Kitasatospora xanthocidica]